MSSPFGLGSPGAPPPPPGKPRRITPLVGALIGLAVLVVAAILVWTVQAIREQGGGGPTTTTEPGGRTTTTEPGGVTGSTSLPTSDRPTEHGALISACPPYGQAFPLPALGCTVLSPPNIKAGERLPLVILLHGFNSSVAQEMTAGEWEASVVRDRFIAEFPESNFSSWNAGICCGLSVSTQSADVTYLQKLVTDAKARSDVDPDQVYLVGSSNGGMMVYRYLCDHADELAGAASVEGTRGTSCTPNAPIPFLHVAGRDDEVVPYLGGQSLTSWVLGVTFPAVEASMDEFAAAAGCSSPPTEQTSGKVTRRSWSGCTGGVPVELDSIQGQRHTWPNSSAYVATDEVLAFFGLGG